MDPVSGTDPHACPPGALARRQYEVQLASGRTVLLCFSLADPDHEVMARMQRKHQASNFGILAILDDPESTEEFVLWFHQATSLTLMSQNGDEIIGEEVQALLPRYFAVFFDEIKDIAPELADIALAPVPCSAGEKNLY